MPHREPHRSILPLQYSLYKYCSPFSNNPNFWAIINGVETKRGGAWLVNSIQTGNAKVILEFFLNLFQTWILLGTVCYIIMEKGKSEFEWIFLLIFLGGFLFHTIWEAGGHIIIYFPFFLFCINDNHFSQMIEIWKENGTGKQNHAHARNTPDESLNGRFGQPGRKGNIVSGWMMGLRWNIAWKTGASFNRPFYYRCQRLLPASYA